MHSVLLSRSRTTRYLFLALGLLVLLHLSMVVLHLVFHRRVEALSQLVDMDLEANLPTFFNVALFFIGAVLFYLHGRIAEKSVRKGWYIMAVAFAFLAIDEGSQIHEKFMLVTLRILNHGKQTEVNMGWFYYAWVLPYGLAGAALVLMLGRWLLRMDADLRKRLAISGLLYILGAVVLEMYSGKVAEGLGGVHLTAEQMQWLPCEIYEHGCCQLYADVQYIVVYTLEEVCEMGGLILCIGALLEAFERRGAYLEVVVGPTPRGTVA